MKEKGTFFNFHCTQSSPIVWLFEVCPGAKCSASRKFTNDDVSCTKVFVSWTTCLTDTDNFVSSIFQCDYDAPSPDWLTFEWRFLRGVLSWIIEETLNNFLSSYTWLHIARFFPTRKNALVSINRHSKNFIARAFPLLMSRRLSKCEG